MLLVQLNNALFEAAEVEEVVENKPRTFKIAVDLLPEVEKKLEKIQKQAKKLGLEPIKLNIIRTFADKVERKVTNPETGKKEKTEVLIRKHEIEVVGEAPKLAGWEFVAKVQGNGIVDVVPGEDSAPVLSCVHDEPGRCDHCHKVRNRTLTYVVKNVDNGEFKQVGSSCLKDFLGGIDPKIVVGFFEWIDSMEQYLAYLESRADDESEGGEGGGSWRSYVWSVGMVLAYAHAIVRHFGYVTSRMAETAKSGMSTASAVRYGLINRPSLKDEPDDWKQIRELFKQITDEDREFAKQVLEWFASIPEETKTKEAFFHNNEIIIKDGNVDSRNVGYLVGLIPTYERMVKERNVMQQREKKPVTNEHVGTPGQKITVDVEVIRTRLIDGYYGRVQIVTMNDAEGRTYVWFNNSRNHMDEGQKYHVTGGVKEHSEFNGTKQTVLTRVKFNDLA